MYLHHLNRTGSTLYLEFWTVMAKSAVVEQINLEVECSGILLWPWTTL